VELNWRMTPQMIEEAKSYAAHMQEMKQIKAVPDMTALMDTRFSDAAAQGA
jgi:NitT/TauT family transport system substrate-binding protein